MAAVLKHNRTITDLSIAACGVGAEGATYLGYLLMENSALRRGLRALFSPPLRPPTTTAARPSAAAPPARAEAERAPAAAWVRRVLDLGWNNLGDAGLKSIATALQTNSVLRELHLNSCGITGARPRATDVHPALPCPARRQSGRWARDLQGSASRPPPSSLPRIGASPPQPRRGETSWRDCGRAPLSGARAHPPPRPPERLAPPSPATPPARAEAHPPGARRRLNLSGNHLGDGGARMVATGLWDNRALVKLELCDNDIGDQGVGAPPRRSAAPTLAPGAREAPPSRRLGCGPVSVVN